MNMILKAQSLNVIVKKSLRTGVLKVASRPYARMVSYVDIFFKKVVKMFRVNMAKIAVVVPVH